MGSESSGSRARANLGPCYKPREKRIEWCLQGENYGPHSPSLFYSTVLHTYHWKNPPHATYMVKAFTYKSSQEGQDSEETYVLIKMRPMPEKQSGGGWGSSSSTKRQRQGWSAYGK